MAQMQYPPTILNKTKTPPTGDGSATPGKFDEVGSIGLEAMSGFIGKAYQAELRWPEVYPVYNRLRRSDPEMTIVRQIFGAVTGGITLEWVPPEDPTPEEERAADFANEVMTDIEGGIETLAQTHVAHVPFMGFGLWEVVPAIRKKGWKPPQDDSWRSSFDDGLLGIRRLAWRDHSTFVRWELHPKTSRVLGFWQMDPPNPEVFIPITKLLHIKWGDPNNPEGLAGLEPVYRLERIKFGLEVVQGIGYEHSAGHLSVTIEEGDLNASAFKANIQAAAKAILSAQPGNYAAWPKGTHGEIIDTPFASAATILEAIRYYGILKMAVFNLQHIAMSTLSGAGSYAAVSDSSAMWLVAYNAMMADFARQVDDTLGPWIFDRNRLEFPDDLRRPTFVARPLDKVVPLAELGTFATAWKAIEGLGEDDLLSIRRRTGFLPEVLAADQGDGEVVKPEPPPVAPAPEPAPAADDGNTEEADAEDVVDDPADEEDATDEAAEKAAVGSMRLGSARYINLGPGFAFLAKSYSAISTTYWETIRNAVIDFLALGSSVVLYRNIVKKAASKAFDEAFTAAYEEGGGEDIDPEDKAWLAERIDRELGFVDGLFTSLRDWRKARIKEGALLGIDISDKAEKVANGYLDGLDAVFSEGRLRGARNVMLTFKGQRGKKPCGTCASLSGLRRSAKWWLKNGLIPGAGNDNYECKGYNCQHRLRDDKGGLFTL